MTQSEYDAWMGLREGRRNGLAGDVCPDCDVVPAWVEAFAAIAHAARAPYWACLWVALLGLGVAVMP